MKHTKGPWKARHFTAKVYDKTKHGKNFYRHHEHSDVTHPSGKLCQVENPLDADLIAAAPEMLEALEYLIKEVSVLPGTGKNNGNIGHRHMNKAIEAIKKAKGE